MEKFLDDYIAEVLCEIIKQNRANKKQDFKEKIYQFNELDLFINMYAADGTLKFLIDHVKRKKDGLIQTSKYSKFDAVKAMDIEVLNGYLQELSMHLEDAKIKTKYEYFINGEIVTPTEEQQEFVKNYLKSNNVPVNEITYSLALRRLIVGGDIESKFDKYYLVNKATERGEKDQEIKNEDTVGV